MAINNMWEQVVITCKPAVRLHGTSAKKIRLKNNSSKAWLQRQMTDIYVKRAQLENWRCRSAFKLLDMHYKYRLFKPGMTVIDCGAAPGSWSQVAAKFVHAGNSSSGIVLSVDRDAFEPVKGCIHLSKANFTHTSTKETIARFLDGRQVDVVMSDMAPNASGHQEMDHENIMNLVADVHTFSRQVLRSGGTMLCKIWQGRGVTQLKGTLNSHFEKVMSVKPPPSRINSAEMFLLCSGFKSPIS